MGGVGEVQLIGINCVGMLMRIGFSYTFIRSYFSSKLALLSPPTPTPTSTTLSTEITAIKSHLHPLTFLPKIPTVVIFVLGGYLVKRSERENDWTRFEGLMRHGFVGAGVGLCGLGVM